MDHFSKNPRFGVMGTNSRQDAHPKIRPHRIRGVEPPAVNPTGQPMLHCRHRVVNCLVSAVIEANQSGMPFKYSGSGTTRRVPVNIEQSGVVALWPLSQHPTQRGVLHTNVAKDPIEEDSQSTPLTGGNKSVEILVSAQPRIDAEMIDGVIPVCL